MLNPRLQNFQQNQPLGGRFSEAGQRLDIVYRMPQEYAGCLASNLIRTPHAFLQIPRPGSEFHPWAFLRVRTGVAFVQRDKWLEPTIIWLL